MVCGGLATFGGFGDVCFMWLGMDMGESLVLRVC